MDGAPDQVGQGTPLVDQCQTVRPCGATYNLTRGFLEQQAPALLLAYLQAGTTPMGTPASFSEVNRRMGKTSNWLEETIRPVHLSE